MGRYELTNETKFINTKVEPMGNFMKRKQAAQITSINLIIVTAPPYLQVKQKRM
jgi:hypothetical protein